jgi:predicted kinase
MGVYRNDYSKEEDLALWMLHEIRHKMARRAVCSDVVNRSAKELIKKRRLTNLKLFKNGCK